MGLIGSLLGGVGSGLSAVKQGLLSMVDNGVNNTMAGAPEGLVNPATWTPAQRHAARSQFLMQLGQGFQAGNPGAGAMNFRNQMIGDAAARQQYAEYQTQQATAKAYRDAMQAAMQSGKTGPELYAALAQAAAPYDPAKAKIYNDLAGGDEKFGTTLQQVNLPTGNPDGSTSPAVGFAGDRGTFRAIPGAKPESKLTWEAFGDYKQAYDQFGKPVGPQVPINMSPAEAANIALGVGNLEQRKAESKQNDTHFNAAQAAEMFRFNHPQPNYVFGGNGALVMDSRNGRIGQTGFDPNSARPVSPTVSKGYNENASMIRKIDQAIQSLSGPKGHPEAVGSFNYLLPEEVIQALHPEATATRAALAEISSGKIHDLAGAQQTLNEMKNMRPFLPTQNDWNFNGEATNTIAKLNRLKQEYQNRQADIENEYPSLRGKATGGGGGANNYDTLMKLIQSLPNNGRQ